MIISRVCISLFLFFTILTSFVFAQCGKSKAESTVNAWYDQGDFSKKIYKIVENVNRHPDSNFQKGIADIPEDLKKLRLHERNIKAILNDLAEFLKKEDCNYQPQRVEQLFDMNYKKNGEGDKVNSMIGGAGVGTSVLLGAGYWAMINASFWATLFSSSTTIFLATATSFPVIGWAIGGAAAMGGGIYYYSQQKSRDQYIVDLVNSFKTQRSNMISNIKVIN
jgi:hypothetical protein